MADVTVLSERDSQRVEAAVRHYERTRHRRDLHRRRNISIASSQMKLAKIVQSLQREDLTADPPVEAIECYKIKLLSEDTYSAWSASYGLYEVGDKVEFEYLDYECIVTHTSSEARKPTNTSFWMCINPDAWILGYAGENLLEVIPWFQINDVVEVVYHEEKYYIHETATKVEFTDGSGNLSCSQSWHPEQCRAIAVYR